VKEFGRTVERHRHDRTFPVSSGVSTSRARQPAWQRTGWWAATNNSGPRHHEINKLQIRKTQFTFQNVPLILTSGAEELVSTTSQAPKSTVIDWNRATSHSPDAAPPGAGALRQSRLHF